MEAVKADQPFGLKSPKTGEILRYTSARDLFQRIIEIRLQTGEPYLIFIDTANRTMAKHQRDLGLKITMSNLCSEIFLPTGRDHLNHQRTAVCCLSSVNAETWDQWEKDGNFIEDVMRFLDNVMQNFIENAPSTMNSARYSATRERSVGLA